MISISPENSGRMLLSKYMSVRFLGELLDEEENAICFCEKPINIWPIVKCWPHARMYQKSHLTRGHVGIRTNQGSRIDYMTE